MEIFDDFQSRAGNKGLIGVGEKLERTDGTLRFATQGEQRNKANSLWGEFTKPRYYTVSSVYFVSVVNFGPQSISLLFFPKDCITTSWAVLIWLPSVFSCLSTLVNIFLFFNIIGVLILPCHSKCLAW